MSDYPMLISNKLHSFRNFVEQTKIYSEETVRYALKKESAYTEATISTP